MTRWPPLVWPLMALASLLILMGLSSYAIAIAVAAISGAQYAAVGVLASFFPLAAVCLLIATTRSKSTGSDSRPDDATPDAADDSLPGIGMDSETPFGDTPEHSTAERVAQPDTRFRREGARSGGH